MYIFHVCDEPEIHIIVKLMHFYAPNTFNIFEHEKKSNN